MPRVLPLLLLAAAVCGAADGDPITRRLDHAKEVFDKEAQKFERGMATWFDEKTAAARRAGDKKLIDQIAAERAAFDQRGAVPAAGPKLLLAQFDAARKAREAVFQQAIRDHTKAGRDDRAAEAEADWRLFRLVSTPAGRAAGGGPTRLLCRHSGKILAIADGSKAEGAATIQFDWTNGADQRWTLLPADDDCFLIRNEQSKLFLTARPMDDKALVISKPAAGDAARAQQWRVTAAKDVPDHYLIQNRASGKFLSIDFGSKDNAARVIQFKLNGPTGTPDQHWKFEPIGK